MRKLFSALFFLFAANFASADFLDLNGYVDMVLKDNADIQALEANIHSINGKLSAIERTYSYYLSAGTSYLNDRSGRNYNKLSSLGYDVSLSKQFETGTQMSVGFNGSYNEVDYLAGGGKKNHDLAPYVRLQQSLMQNYDGGATKAGLAKARADAQSALYLLQYQKQSIIFQAKIAYWNLSYARTVIDFKKTSLGRSQKILDWNERRYKLDLAERTDMLQSQAAVKMGELNLKLAYENEIKARRAFNLLLNVDGANVNYEIEKFTATALPYKQSKTLDKYGTRADVLSALEKVKSAQFDQESQSKTSGADLILSGQFALNGVDYPFGDASVDVVSASKPSYSLGVRYLMPLDFKIQETVNKGYEAAILAAQKSAQSASISENNQWLQLVDNWNNAKARLDLSMEIRTVQQQRHDEEQSLLKKGRSTTYMVIQSEQALDDAELGVLQNIFELISIYEQAEAFYNNK